MLKMILKPGRFFGKTALIAFFALAFLAFCLTAVALYALSRGKDDVADKSVSGLSNLQWSSLVRPKSPDADQEEPNSQPDSEQN
jgi:hypothetical protein